MKQKFLAMILAFLVSIPAAFAQNTPDMLEKALGAVVTVAVYKSDNTKTALGFRGDANRAYERILDLSNSESSGSGFIIRRNGKLYVVTNAHVVENAADGDGSLFVYSITRAKYAVKIVGGDSFYDLAVLEFIDQPGAEVETVDFRKNEARIGEQVFAIGNPLGEYPYTVTEGIISAKNRVRNGITGKFGFLQTTATVIWGNSGGPLIDQAGQVLGINSQIAFASRNNTQIWQPQINFALEANISSKLVDDIISNNGLVKRAYVGLEVSQTYEYNEYMELFGSPWIQKDSLPVIKQLIPGSPAEKALAGKKGAAILKVNGETVRSVQEVLGELEKTPAGSTIRLTLQINGKTEEVAFKTGTLNTTDLENLARFVMEKNTDYKVTWDGDKVIINATSNRTQPDTKKEQPRKEEREDDLRKREENLRYRGVVQEATYAPNTRYNVVAGGIENDNYSSIWRVKKLSDLGAAFRLSGLSGVFNIYVSDPQYGGDPQAIQINPGGSDSIFQSTLWY